MKNKKLLLIVLFVLFICCGCSGKYTLTYEDDMFNEEIILSNLNEEEKKTINRYQNGTEYLKIDEKDSYFYSESNNKKIYKYKMGKEFKVSPLMKQCFDNVFVVDEKDYINIKTDGKYYCSGYDLEVYFKTDKKVLYSNASIVENNTYKWDKLSEGIEIHFSKTELYDDMSITNNTLNDLYIRLAIGISFIVVISGVVIYLKKKNPNMGE